MRLIVALILLAITSILPANATPFIERNIDHTTIRYAVPAGFVDLKTANPTVFERYRRMYLSKGTDVLSLFVPVHEAKLYEEFEKYFYVKITNKRKNKSYSVRDFSSLRNEIRKELEHSSADFYKGSDKSANEALKKVRAGLSVRDGMVLGLILDESRSLSTVTASKVQTGSDAFIGLSSLAYVLLADKVVTFSAYRMLESPADIQRIEADTVNWVRQSLQITNK
ncbi:hypothetical protein D3C72_826850 [compost metagenome]